MMPLSIGPLGSKGVAVADSIGATRGGSTDGVGVVGGVVTAVGGLAVVGVVVVVTSVVGVSSSFGTAEGVPGGREKGLRSIETADAVAITLGRGGG